MSNTIILKNGEGPPSNLETAELGFDTTNESLYIGDQNKIPVGIFDKRAFRFVNGAMILGETIHGENLPAAGTVGRLFLKKVE